MGPRLRAVTRSIFHSNDSLRRSSIVRPELSLIKHPTAIPPKRTRSRRPAHDSLLRATPNHVDHGKMARFFGSMAGRAAGMRKALFTNGPGIKTLASAGVGCVGLQLKFGTRALTQPRTEPKELETKFSYDGWQMDAELAEKCDKELINDPFFGPFLAKVDLWAVLDTMHRKQQVHDGDRSHPFIRKLDALTPTLSYAGWEDDAKKMEWPNAFRRFDLFTHPNVRWATFDPFWSRLGNALRGKQGSYFSWSSTFWMIPLKLCYTPRGVAYLLVEHVDLDTALARMRLEQAKHEIHTESSDAKQRRLNDNVVRLERKLSSWFA